MPQNIMQGPRTGDILRNREPATNHRQCMEINLPQKATNGSEPRTCC